MKEELKYSHGYLKEICTYKDDEELASIIYNCLFDVKTREYYVKFKNLTFHPVEPNYKYEKIITYFYMIKSLREKYFILFKKNKIFEIIRLSSYPQDFLFSNYSYVNDSGFIVFYIKYYAFFESMEFINTLEETITHNLIDLKNSEQ